MKASEFVKNHGLNKAKVLLSTQGKTIANLKSEYAAEQLKEYQGYIVSDDLMSFVELKRLVESHELVEKYKNRHGGIRFRIRWGMYRYGDTQQFNDRLKQAIADVESCQ